MSEVKNSMMESPDRRLDLVSTVGLTNLGFVPMGNAAMSLHVQRGFQQVQGKFIVYTSAFAIKHRMGEA